MIKEHDTVVLVSAVPAEGLLPGDVGTVVHVYRDGQACEVEFTTLEGKTAAVITLEASRFVLSGNARSLTPASWLRTSQIKTQWGHCVTVPLSLSMAPGCSLSTLLFRWFRSAFPQFHCPVP